jgi:hypothetical protein
MGISNERAQIRHGRIHDDLQVPQARPVVELKERECVLVGLPARLDPSSNPDPVPRKPRATVGTGHDESDRHAVEKLGLWDFGGRNSIWGLP